MKATCSTETPVDFQRTKRYIPEDTALQRELSLKKFDVVTAVTTKMTVFWDMKNAVGRKLM
jgi:hypothetical protein